MATKRASIILAVDGGAKFKQELNNATKETRLYKTELKAVQQEFKDTQNSMEALTEKQKALTKIQESYAKQLTSAKSGYENAVKHYEAQQKAVDGLSEKLEEAKKALADYQSAGGTDATKTQKLQAEVDRLSSALEKQESNLKRAEGNVTSWKAAQVKAESDLKSINREIDKNDQYLDEASKSADRCAKSIDKYGKEAGEASGEVGELGKQSSIFGDVLSGSLASTAITAGISALKDAAGEAIQYVIGVGSEFEAAMSKVEALSGATGGELEALNQKAQELGASTQFSASEVAEAMSSMALAGWDTKEMLEGIDGVLYLAASGQMDLANASDAVAGYLAAFNMEASESARLADIMATAQAKSKTTADQLAEAYSTSATNLTGYGQGVETTTALLEAMASVNDTGSSAGTKLNAVMAQIVKKMKDGAIAIGDTQVSVQDANGDFRDMVDIVADIEKATSGMAEAERASALQTTFNRTSLSGLNELLGVGSEKLRQYKTDLENSEGAAKGMADTMQDNLQGDLKELSSATEGLGIAAYDIFKGPMRGAVQLITGGISGITDAITPASDRFAEMTERMKTANSELRSSLDTSKGGMSDAETDALKVGIYVEQLKRLNLAQQEGSGTETEALSRKMQMQEIIDQLGTSIPEIAEAWDAETGKLNLQNKELDNMAQKYKDIMIQRAAMDSMQEITNKLVQANLDLGMGEAEAERLKEEKEALEELQTVYGEYQRQYFAGEMTAAKAEEAKSDLVKKFTEACEDNIITLEERDKLIEGANPKDWAKYQNDQIEGFKTLSQMVVNATDAYDDQNEAIEENKTLQMEAQRVYDNAQAVVDKTTESLKANGEQTELTAETVKEKAVGIAKEFIYGLPEAVKTGTEQASEFLSKLSEQTTQTAEEAEKSAEEVQAAAKAQAQAQAELAEITRTESDKVIDAYEDVIEEAKKSTEVDFFGEFDGGEDEAVSTMLERAQSNITALQQYKENLKEVSDHVGKEIAPEFLLYLESLGVDGANMLQNISLAFSSEEGTRQVKEWSDAYLRTLDIQDQTAEIIAGDKIALSDGFADLGSTDADFDTLRQNIDLAVQNALEGWDKLPDETRNRLQGTIDLCQQMGIKIPDGLADGIISGTDTPDIAISQLEESIKGRFAGLLEIAKEQGLDITENISNGMDEGGEALVTAYNELVALITASGGDAETKMAEKGQADGSKYGSGVGSATTDVETGAKSLTDAATTALNAESENFKTAGSSSATSYATGLSAGTDAVRSSAYTLASTARQALAEYAGNFERVGVQIDVGVASGVYNGSSAVLSAVVTVARNALNAMKAALGIQSPSKVFREQVGKWIPAGVAEGIEEATPVATNAIRKLSTEITKSSYSWITDKKRAQDVSARDEANYWKGIVETAEQGSTAYQVALSNYTKANLQANRDAQEWADTARWKMSHNFNISRTTTTGSGDNQKTVLKDTTTYYNELYSAAQKYFSNMTSACAVSAESEVAYWKIIAQNLAQGGDAWHNAMAKVHDAQQKMIKDEQTYKDNAVKLIQETERALDEARQKIVDDAEDYLRKKKILNGEDLEYELQYWQAVLKKLDQYTDQWYDVYETISDLKDDIKEKAKEAREEEERQKEEAVQTQVDLQSKLLSNWKIYYTISSKGEMDYWKRARRVFKEGTQERIDADARYEEAKEKYYDDLRELDEKYQSDFSDVQDKLQDKINDLTKTYKDSITSREQAILGQMDLFSEFDAEGLGSDAIMKAMESQVVGLTKYAQILENLKDRGILDKSLIEELEDMGPDASVNIAGLAQMSDKDLRTYNELYRERQRLAHQQALRDNRDLLDETIAGIQTAKDEAKVELDELTKVFQEELAKLQEVMDPKLQSYLGGVLNFASDWFTPASRELDGVKKNVRDTTYEIQGLSKTLTTEIARLEAVTPSIGENALTGLLKGLVDADRIKYSTDALIEQIKQRMQDANLSVNDLIPSFEIPAVDVPGLNSSVSFAGAVSVDNSDILMALQKTITAIDRVATALDGASVTLDSGELVGAIHTAISEAQASEYLIYNRGR